MSTSRALRDEKAATGKVQIMANRTVDASCARLFRLGRRDQEGPAHQPLPGASRRSSTRAAAITSGPTRRCCALRPPIPLGTARAPRLCPPALQPGSAASDIVRLGRQHIKDGWLTIHAGKTGKASQVPVLDVLRRGYRRHQDGRLDVPGQRRRPAAHGVAFRRLVPRRLRPGWGGCRNARRTG